MNRRNGRNKYKTNRMRKCNKNRLNQNNQKGIDKILGKDNK